MLKAPELLNSFVGELLYINVGMVWSEFGAVFQNVVKHNLV